MERIEGKEYYAYKETYLSDGKYDYVEFMLKGEDVNYTCHSGPNDYEALEVSCKPYVQEQIKDLSDDFLRGFIRAYGLEVEEYETREDLESFLVWSAAWDIFEDDTYNEEDEQERAA